MENKIAYEEKNRSEFSEIQNTLGRLEEGVNGIKEDISELKQNDILADKRLEEAYQKAMAYASTRQDKIREDLQHQIDHNKEALSVISSELKELNLNIRESNKELKDFVNTNLELINTRLTNIETQKEKKLLKTWNTVIDRLILILAFGALAAFLKWLGFGQIASQVMK